MTTTYADHRFGDPRLFFRTGCLYTNARRFIGIHLDLTRGNHHLYFWCSKRTAHAWIGGLSLRIGGHRPFFSVWVWRFAFEVSFGRRELVKLTLHRLLPLNG